jgi:hypothetical protein
MAQSLLFATAASTTSFPFIHDTVFLQSRWSRLALAITALSEPPVAAVSAPDLAIPADVEPLHLVSEGTTYSVTINPGQASLLRVGNHQLYIPAGAVCDPRVSSYGPGEWNKPCATISSPLTIYVRASRDALGRPRVNFHPNVRFEPSKSVILEMSDALGASLRWNLVFCADDQTASSGRCVDEGRNDSEMRTSHDALDGSVKRRIKHFSGYEIAAT